MAPGVWGGDHAALTVIETGAHLELDCASGDISGRLSAGGDGRFSVEGVFVVEHAGPVRSDETPERKPARFSGRVEGGTMSLDVTLVESNTSVGRFALELGRAPGVKKCR